MIQVKCDNMWATRLIKIRLGISNWLNLCCCRALETNSNLSAIPPKVATPGAPGTVLHPVEEAKLSDKDQFMMRSGVGKLLHLMKWSRLEIGNAVHKLSHFMNCTGVSHLKAMYRVMNYCLNTRN